MNTLCQIVLDWCILFVSFECFYASYAQWLFHACIKYRAEIELIRSLSGSEK